MSQLVEECLDGLASTVLMNDAYSESKCGQLLHQPVTDDSLNDLAACMSVDDVGPAHTVISRLLNAVVAHSGCLIDRFCVSGSIGHQPSIGCEDKLGFDITVFVETSEKSFGEHQHVSAEKVYHSIENIIGRNSVLCDHLGLHFEMEGFQFHLAITPALGHRMHEQRKRVWDFIQEAEQVAEVDLQSLDKYSISMHESLTAFMHLGDPVLHGLVRLARFWRRQHSQFNVSPIAIVLVMMRCIEDEKTRVGTVGKFPVKRVFIEFLSAIARMNTLRMSWHRFYIPELVPKRMAKDTAGETYLIDPVNPWRNLLPKDVGNISSSANACIEQLKNPDCTLYDIFSSRTTSTRGG